MLSGSLSLVELGIGSSPESCWWTIIGLTFVFLRYSYKFLEFVIGWQCFLGKECKVPIQLYRFWVDGFRWLTWWLFRWMLFFGSFLPQLLPWLPGAQVLGLAEFLQNWIAIWVNFDCSWIWAAFLWPGSDKLCIGNFDKKLVPLSVPCKLKNELHWVSFLLLHYWIKFLHWFCWFRNGRARSCSRHGPRIRWLRGTIVSLRTQDRKVLSFIISITRSCQLLLRLLPVLCLIPNLVTWTILWRYSRSLSCVIK